MEVYTNSKRNTFYWSPGGFAEVTQLRSAIVLSEAVRRQKKSSGKAFFKSNRFDEVYEFYSVNAFLTLLGFS